MQFDHTKLKKTRILSSKDSFNHKDVVYPREDKDVPDAIMRSEEYNMLTGDTIGEMWKLLKKDILRPCCK